MSKLSFSQQKTYSPMLPTFSSTRLDKTQKQDITGMPLDRPEINQPQNQKTNRGGQCRAGTDKTPRERPSVNLTDQRGTAIDTNSSFFSKKTDTTGRSRGGLDIYQLGDEEEFKCPLCSSTDTQPCPACFSNGSLNKDSSLIKFLAYVIEFKFGRRPAYPPEHPLSASCASYPSNPDNAQALRMTEPGRLSKPMRMSLQERKNQSLNIHYGYFCNSCNNDQPIQGARFNCLICQDYDLCQRCYNQRGHKHLMTEISVSPSYRHSLNCWQLLKQRQEMGTLKGMKVLHGRIAQLEEKIYSSSIR